MTTWDKIYKHYQRGGDAWATLSVDVDPLFETFVRQLSFERKHSLDIGCGTGKHMKFLQGLGFKTDGIDSSETAVEMTKQLLGNNSRVVLADMFDYQISANTYDLIFSISTIHHGLKSSVQNLMDRIYEALLPGGHILITVPDIKNVISKKWNTFKDHTEVAAGTFTPNTGPETGLPHSFYTEEEAKSLFSKFRKFKLHLDKKDRWVAQATK